MDASGTGRRRGRRHLGVVALLALSALLATPAAIAVPPILSGVPGDQVLEATSPAGATATWPDPTAVDGNGDPIPVTCAPPSGSTFAIGTTTVTCEATDPNTSETATQSFSVTVQDTTPPSVSVPGDITLEATGPSGAVATFSVSASDIVDGSLPVSCSPTSGSAFGLGTSTVTCSATDTHGNTGSDSFAVTVQDTTAPAISVPGNITLEATGPGGAVATFSASATDLVDTSPTVTCAPASGSVFPLGATLVSCTATDDSGNSAGGSFTVTVRDTAPPTVSVPSDMTLEATGPGGAVAIFSASATDLVDPSPTVNCTPASGSTFAITTTVVSCSATDASGNTSSPKTFAVTVRDTTAPTVIVPGNLIAEAAGPSGAVVTFSASGSDIVDGALAATCSPASGSTFPLATTKVTCSATDSRANTGTASFTVTVRDTIGPVFSRVPSDVVAEADGPTGSRVTYLPPTAVDAVNGPVLVACTPGPGSLFPLGSSTVTCTATDSRANSTAVSFAVKVVDTTKPALNVPRPETVSSSGGQTVARTDPQVASFLASASARDSVDGAVAVENDAPEVLPLGTTRITFTASDRAGNVASAQSELTVVTSPVTPGNRDTTPPKDVTKLKAKPGDRSVLLTWVAPKTDFHHVTVTRARSEAGGTPAVVYKGSATRFRDTRLTNGVEYRYLVVSYDAAGNFSPGAAVRAVPFRPLLYAPTEGAVLTRPPVLQWASVANASYYNVQVYRARLGKPGQIGTKILSAWPVRPRYALSRSWKFEGRVQRLTPGRYVWFAWPGLGPKAANRYGPVLGQSSFVIKSR